MLSSPYFRRVFLPSLLLILSGTLVVGFWGAAQIRATYLERTEDGLLPQAMLLRDLLDEAPDDLQRRVQQAGSEIGRRITVIDADGTVLADSVREPSSLDNQLSRPEVRQAAESGTGMQIRGDARERTMYLAVRVGPAEAPRRFVRLAISVGNLDKSVRALYARLAAVALIAFLLAGLICYLVARQAVRPIVRLTQTATALASGDLDQDSAPDDPGEIGDLGAALNHLAGSLRVLASRGIKREEELRAVLSSMVEAVIAVDDRGCVSVANASAGRLLGFEPETARGRPLRQVVQHSRVLEAADEVRRSGRMVRARIGPTPGALEVAVVICPVSSQGQQEGLVIVAHDAAESPRYQQLRTEFVANVSHELRTPLAIIQGFVETLQNGASENAERRQRFLELIARNVAQLNNLVDDLLQLAELEERPHELHPEPVDLAAMLEEVCTSFRQAAEKKHQSLEFTCEPGVPPVLGSPRLLERAFANLVDNAIKYTDEGGWIRVAVRRHKGSAILTSPGSAGLQSPAAGQAASDRPPAAWSSPASLTPGQDSVMVIVEDTGIGIPEQDLPRIFERFYRVDKSRSREMGGTGLGLSIVKHVVQSHGGAVRVVSKPGQGSKFKVIFPGAQGTKARVP